MDRHETESFLDRVLDRWPEHGRPTFHALVERSSGDLMGWAGLSVPDFLPEVLPATEVGWRLGSRYWGRGYATEAATASLDWGFEELGLISCSASSSPTMPPRAGSWTASASGRAS